MRIAYISLHWPRPKTSSIGKKIDLQTGIWRSSGHEVRFFSHMHPYDNPAGLVEGDYFIYQLQGRGLLSTETSRMRAMGRLIRELEAYQPDIIYLRWGMYVHPLKRIFRIAPVVVEVNTNDVIEHHLLGMTKSVYNRLTRAITLQSADGHLFPTHELSELQVFTRFNRPFRVISNGIDITKVKPIPAPTNPVPHLVFIGTPGMPWHGVDKLVPLAERFTDILIDIVGYDEIPGHPALPPNLHLHGLLEGAGYDRILEQADAAIGSMSLHCNHMQEAAPLKVRDCAARGIPCILPYRDTDLDDLDTPCILKIPNSPENILQAGQQVHDFVHAMRGKRLERHLVEPRIDAREKEGQRLAFIDAILEKQPASQ